MSEHPAVTDEAVERASQAYWEARRAENDGGPQGQTHAWMRAALEAAAPLLGPRPLLDEKAVARAITNATGHASVAITGVMELARPMPTREEISSALMDSGVAQYVRHEAPGHTWVEGYAQVLADAVLALLNGAES